MTAISLGVSLRLIKASTCWATIPASPSLALESSSSTSSSDRSQPDVSTNKSGIDVSSLSLTPLRSLKGQIKDRNG